ncbi:membrane protein insertase YidC, partial [Halomonas sp. BBD48]|nr:membrane protein insertase YidC [Halomonas sp. BBD48]
MDVKRLLLVIPLAVLAYLLVIQWNQDYGQPNVNVPSAPTVSEAPPGSNDAAATDEQGLA